MDKVIEILKSTHDGEDLSPRHLHLLQVMINATQAEIDKEVEAAFEDLHHQVMSGQYDKSQQYVYGVKHLTRDHDGYIFWKGQRVEHYSFADFYAGRAAAQDLAERCEKLESLGLPVNMRTSSDDALFDVPAGSPWIPLLLSVYSTMRRTEDGAVVVIDSISSWDALAVVRKGASSTRQVFREESYSSGQYKAFHHFQRQGFRSVFEYGESGRYLKLIEALESNGFSPEDFTVAHQQEVRHD